MPSALFERPEQFFVGTREFKTRNGDTHRFTMNDGGKTVSYENIHPLGFKLPNGKPATQKYGFSAFLPQTALNIYKQLKQGSLKPMLDEKIDLLKGIIEEKREQAKIILDKNGAMHIFTHKDDGKVDYFQRYELGYVTDTSVGRMVTKANQVNLFEKTLPAEQAKNIFEQLTANAYVVLTEDDTQVAELESQALSSPGR